VLCDIDLFKSINDTRGHDCGDQILRQFGARRTTLAKTRP
jgi:diguanylate cyclase (GGDEF)-like protein